MAKVQKAGILFLFVATALFQNITLHAQPFGMKGPQHQDSHAGILCSQNGRFVFGQISESEKDQFMLDTLTGRLWRIAERGDVGKHLISVPYCNSKGECSVFPKTVSDETPSKHP